MTVKSFLVCNVGLFHTDNFLVPIQTELMQDEGSSVISIELSQENFHRSFNQYLSYHDFKHKKSGKVYNLTFNYYFEPLKFYTYFDKAQDLALIQTKTEAAIDFVDNLNGSKYYRINPIEIDFAKLVPHITEVAGAWIADLKKTNLKTAGFFGPNVNRSEEYKQAAAEGNVSSLQLRYISNDQNEYYIGISKKGSIILYSSLPTIKDEIDLVIDVYEKLIKPHL